MFAAFVPVVAQGIYMSVPVPGSTTSDEYQSVVFTFSSPSEVDPSTIELWVDGVMYTTSSPELSWAPANLYFTPSTPFAEGEVRCSLAVVLNWDGDTIEGLPVVGSFFVDLSGPYVIASGLLGATSTPLPTTVTNDSQGGEWYIVDDYSDIDPFSIVVQVNGVTYTYPSPGLLWEDHIVFATDTIIDSIVGADTFYSYIDHYADRIVFDPVAAGLVWDSMDTVSMALLQVHDTPQYGSSNDLQESVLNSFYFFVDYRGPRAEMISPTTWREEGVIRTSCADQQFVFDVYDESGVDLGSVQVSARGVVIGYSASYFDVETLEVDTVFHLYVPDTVFRVWAVDVDYGWEARCNIEETYTESTLTCWAVTIFTPLPPGEVYETADYMGREAAKEAAFNYAALGYDALIELIVPNWDDYTSILETYGCTEGENVYIVGTDAPMPGSFLYDTLVVGRDALNLVANMYYPEMGWGIEPVFGRVSHPFFAAVHSLVPTRVRFTYTPYPDIYEGETFHLELLACSDVYGNPLEAGVDVSWDVVGDRSAPYVVSHTPEHNAIITDLNQPISVVLADDYGAVDPHTIRMHIQTSSGFVHDIDSLPLPPWPSYYIWDRETGTFTFDPQIFGTSWNQGDTVTVIFYDVADSIDFCGSNQFAHEHPFVAWTFYIVDGPYLTDYFPTNGSFVACPTQPVGFTLYDPDGIDPSTVIFEIEGQQYDITTEDTSVVCHWVHTDSDSFLVGCDTIIYDPLQYLGGGAFQFVPPQDLVEDGRQIDCRIVQAQDSLGNSMWYVGDFSWYYIYDFTGPVYYDPQPEPGGYASGDSLVISIALDDSVSGRIDPTRLYFSIGGSYFGPVTHPEYCWWDGERFYLDFGIAGTTFPDGEEITVCLASAYDGPDYICGANPNPAEGLPYCWSFTVDNRPPEITLLEPAVGSHTACATQPVKILLADNLGVDPESPVMVVEGVIYTMSSPELELVGDTLVFTPSTPWVDGQVVDFSLAQVSDVAGNALSGSPLISQFVVDLSAPAVYSTTPADGEVVGTALPEISVTVDDPSGITPETAQMTITVVPYTDTTETTTYAFAFDDSLFSFTSSGELYTVGLDLALAGVDLPARGADVAVRFVIQDAPDYACFAAPDVYGNELDYTFSFSITPGWRLPLMMVPTVLVYDSTGTPIEASGDTVVLVMGAAFGATDGYDEGIDELAPPFPPDTAGLTVIPPSFLLDTLRLVVDLKSLESESPTWMIWTGTTQGTLWWDTAGLPDYGSFVINGYLDMRSTNFFAYDPGEAIYINFSPELITLYAGWNLVSVPVQPDDPTPTSVFPVPAYNIFWYNPWSMGFEHPVAIYPGYAYFVLYAPEPGEPDHISFSVPGEPVYSFAVTMPVGWNTIGSVYDFGGVPVSSITTVPTGGVWGSGVYGYDATAGAYYYSSSIYPGLGYWIYIDLPAPYTTCVCSVSASWMRESASAKDGFDPEEVAHLVVDGTELVLARQSDATCGADPDLDRLMPPAMPGQSVSAYLLCDGKRLSRDVRPDGNWTLVLTQNATLSVDRPITVNGYVVDGSVELEAGVYKLAFADRRFVPSRLALYQNNPNPFNPTTDITFDLPHRAEVKLEVYNMLGQRVRTLVSGELAAGRYTVRWDGTDESGRELVSGVYFYRLTTGGETLTKRMVLLR